MNSENTSTTGQLREIVEKVMGNKISVLEGAVIRHLAGMKDKDVAESTRQIFDKFMNTEEDLTDAEIAILTDFLPRALQALALTLTSFANSLGYGFYEHKVQTAQVKNT